MKNVKEGHEQPILCLNAGHSGKANQSPVVPEYYESEMTWKLHNYLAEEVEKYGIKTVKTREKQEVGMDLRERGLAAKGSDLWLSLHSNACDTENVDRPVMIHLVDDNCGMIDEQSKELAILLGKTIRETMGTKQKEQIMSKKASTDKDGDGKINDEWYAELRGAHDAGVAGIIVEHSFHTNTKMAKWLLKDENLKKLAKAEARTIAVYFGMNEVKEAEPEVPKAEEKAEAPEAEKKTVYRIRKSWEDAASQEGAFYDLEKAIRACPVGYSVFDEDGKAVHLNVPAPDKPDYATGFDQKKAGSYIVTAQGGLNLRLGASITRKVAQVLKKGETVKCYGYYTGQWLYVVSNAGVEGFCHGEYLQKK